MSAATRRRIRLTSKIIKKVALTAALLIMGSIWLLALLSWLLPEKVSSDKKAKINITKTWKLTCRAYRQLRK